MTRVGAGVAIGIPLALGLTRLMASQLVGVSRTEPLTYAGTAARVSALGLAGPARARRGGRCASIPSPH